MKVIIVDPTAPPAVLSEHDIPSLTVVEGMFVKELKMCPLAFVFQAEYRQEVLALLKEVEEHRRVLREIEGNIYYKELPKYRAVPTK